MDFTQVFLSFIFFIVFDTVPLLFWVFIGRAIANTIRRINSRKYFKNNIVDYRASDNTKEKKVYRDVSKNKLAIFNTEDIDPLKDFFYDLFVKFEEAYNNLDYNMMKMISTKQLFYQYYTGISLDLKVGRKRIINDIQRKKVTLYEVDSTSYKQTASLMIEVSYINYVLDHNGHLISGDREKPMTEKFEVTFRKDFEKENVVKCPNCGANVVGNRCEFCRSIIKNVDFKISSIKRIVE